MKIVLVRDDDTNATTPPYMLERLYRPLLERQIPVNLAVIPEVRLNVRLGDGRLEPFIHGPLASSEGTLGIGKNQELISYLRSEKGYCLAQHGLHHDRFEFAGKDDEEAEALILKGLRSFEEAGLERPIAFVAPQDKFSAGAIRAVIRHFRVVSGGYYNLSTIPRPFWATYLFQKKVLGREVLRLGNALLLSHRGCKLRPNVDLKEAIAQILADIESHRISVIVLHHSEFFKDGREDKPMVEALHRLAEEVANMQEVKFASFKTLLSTFFD